MSLITVEERDAPKVERLFAYQQDHEYSADPIRCCEVGHWTRAGARRCASERGIIEDRDGCEVTWALVHGYAQEYLARPHPSKRQEEAPCLIRSQPDPELSDD